MYPLNGRGHSESFFFCTSGLLLLDQPLPAGVVVLEGCSILLPNLSWLFPPLCVRVVVLRGSFPDLHFLSRTVAHKTLNLSFSGISLFGSKWWSWKDYVEMEFLQAEYLHVWLHPWGHDGWQGPQFWHWGGCRFLLLLLAFCLMSLFLTQVSQGLCWLRWFAMVTLWHPLC